LKTLAFTDHKLQRVSFPNHAQLLIWNEIESARFVGSNSIILTINATTNTLSSALMVNI